MMKTEEKQLKYLSELSDYKVDDQYADVRDWEVKDSALRPIGTVKNLLVNMKSKQVVYLDVKVDATIIDAKHDPYGTPANPDMREFVNEKGENHIIIPIGLVDIDMERKYVFTESIDHNTFASTKRIRENMPIDRGYENSVLSSYRRNYDDQPTTGTTDGDMENSEVYRKERENRTIQSEYSSGERESNQADDEMDRYDAEHENAKINRDEKEEFFYRSKEFDVSKKGKN